MVQLTDGVINFISAGYWADSAKFVQIIDDAADGWILSRVAVRIGKKYAGGFVPFRVRVAAGRRIFSASNIKCFGAYIFHGRAQYATESAGWIGITLGLIHQITHRCNS